MNEQMERRFNRLRGDSSDLACVYEYIQRLEATAQAFATDDEGREIIDMHVKASIDHAGEVANYCEDSATED